MEVLKGGRWLFTYAEPAGTFATTDKPETIPEADARALVRVIDPARADERGRRSGLRDQRRRAAASGKSSARAMSREAFETAALAALPRRPVVAVRAHHAEAPPGRRCRSRSTPPGPVPPDAPLVTIYGTSWCGACRAAREYMTERKIPFADKDIERDPGAAQELADKASKMGIPTDRVPVIDVRGAPAAGVRPGAHRGAAGTADMRRRLATAAWVGARRRRAGGPSGRGAADRPLRRGDRRRHRRLGRRRRTRPDFFDDARAGGSASISALKLLVFDLSTNFFQTFNDSGASGTLIQFLLGTEIDIPIGEAKIPDGQSQNVLKPEIAGGFGFGTPGPVEPAADRQPDSAKGFVANATLGYEYYFNPFIAVGAQATFGYHYFFGGDAVNEPRPGPFVRLPAHRPRNGDLPPGILGASQASRAASSSRNCSGGMNVSVSADDRCHPRETTRMAGRVSAPYLRLMAPNAGILVLGRRRRAEA